MNDAAPPKPRHGYDPTLPTRPPGTRAPRPKDAATLIIWRAAGDSIEVLMGERHQGTRFMPNRYVFPGGRVDPSDARVRAGTPLKPEVADRLTRAATPSRARALAAAAIRETFEETGLVIGAPDPSPGRPAPKGWEKFFAAGFAPAFDRLDYVGRAVTPPLRPLRFHARFFTVEARHVSGEIAGSGELNKILWVPIAETAKLQLPQITAKVLGQVAQRRGAPVATSFVFIHTPNGHVMKEE